MNVFKGSSLTSLINATIALESIPPLKNAPNGTSATNLLLTDLVSLANGDQSGLTYCGTRTMSLDNDHSGLVSIDPVAQTISAVTTDSNKIATRESTLTITLDDYPTVTFSVTFTIIVEPSCSDVTISAVSSPFSAGSSDTFISGIQNTWAGGDLASINTSADCGPFSYTFYQSKDGGTVEPIDSSIFTVDETNKMIMIYTESPGDAGFYVITFDAGLTDYTMVAGLSQVTAFTWEIKDACLSTNGLSVNAMVPLPDSISTYYYSGD